MNPRNSPNNDRPTKADKFLIITADGNWHSTRELVHRVGHTFGGAKFKLIRQGHDIEVRKHPSRDRQYQYRRVLGHRPPPNNG